MTPRESVLVGVDLGTSSVKVVACTAAGTCVAQGSAVYPLATPRPQYVEQDAEDVYRATMSTLHGVIGEVHLRGLDVAAIGFSSAMHGIMPVDAAGEPAGPLITWMDRRSADVAERWRQDGTAAELYALTGAPVHAMLPSCKLRWLAEHDGVAAQAARFASLKELVVFRWTGEWLVDWGIASATGLFDIRTRVWSERALQLCGIEASRLSQPARPSTTLRSIGSTVATALDLDAHTPLVLGSSDGALANLGVGAVARGEMALTLGTSGAIRVVTPNLALEERGRTFCYAFDDALYLAGGPTSSAGAVLNKIQALVMPEVAPFERFPQAVALAEEAPAGANGLTMLPFLSGERAPYWRSQLRGGFAGLDLSHTRGDILRAAFESIVFALGSVLEVLRARTGAPERVRLSGGLTHAALVRQLIADVFNCEAWLGDQEEASAFGAAMLAGIAIGALRDADAVAALLHPVHVHAPNPAAVERYREVFERYRACVDATLPLYG